MTDLDENQRHLDQYQRSPLRSPDPCRLRGGYVADLLTPSLDVDHVWHSTGILNEHYSKPGGLHAEPATNDNIHDRNFSVWAGISVGGTTRRIDQGAANSYRMNRCFRMLSPIAIE